MLCTTHDAWQCRHSQPVMHSMATPGESAFPACSHWGKIRGMDPPNGTQHSKAGPLLIAAAACLILGGVAFLIGLSGGERGWDRNPLAPLIGMLPYVGILLTGLAGILNLLGFFTGLVTLLTEKRYVSGTKKNTPPAFADGVRYQSTERITMRRLRSSADSCNRFHRNWPSPSPIASGCPVRGPGRDLRVLRRHYRDQYSSDSRTSR